jgi:hypothetical protein
VDERETKTAKPQFLARLVCGGDGRGVVHLHRDVVKKIFYCPSIHY